jgi:hypothetical protein
MKYAYTDITTIESNIALPLSDIESLIQYFSKLEDPDKNFTISKFERVLIQARQNTYDLMGVYVDSNRRDEDV